MAKNNDTTKNYVRQSFAKRRTIRITLTYFLVGAIWIIMSDVFMDKFAVQQWEVVIINIAKGLFYVTVTAGLIFWLIYSALKEVEKTNTKLKENEILFRTVFNQAPVGIAIGRLTDSENLSDDIYMINPQLENIVGRSEGEIMREKWDRIVHPDDISKEADIVRKLLSGKVESFNVEKRYLKPDGSVVWAYTIVTKLNLGNENEEHYLRIVQDITDRKNVEDALFESERSKSVLLSNLPGMAYRCKYDRDWTMQFVSEGCYELTGYKPENYINNRDLTFNDSIAPEYRDYLWEKWASTLKENRLFQVEYEIISADGQRKWVLEIGQGVYDSDGNVEALEGIIIDISDRKEKELRLKYISEHDPLTDLYNRRCLEEKLESGLIELPNRKRAIILLSLSNISAISLTYGYAISDKIVRELADKLKALTSADREVYHLSLKQFAFCYENYMDEEELVEFSRAVLDIFMSIPMLQIVGCGIGILQIDKYNYDVDTIIKYAAIASENATKDLAFGYDFFEDDLVAKLNREADVKEELIRILLENYGSSDEGIILQYQPIIDLRTSAIVGFEALARLKSNKLGVVPPDEFIPLAEETQLISEIGKEVMCSVCSAISTVRSMGYEDLRFYVNISPIELLRNEFIEELTAMIELYGINPENLGLEITESVFTDRFDLINEKLRAIKEMGLYVAIDDFGTGYSSLARESELNVDCLKIDKIFIDRLLQINPTRAITGDIISMAHKMGHIVVAEGVEDEMQVQYLKDNNCDMMQGFLFCKPIDFDSALRLLSKETPGKSAVEGE